MSTEKHQTEQADEQEMRERESGVVKISKVLRAAALVGLLGVVEACGGVPREVAKEIPITPIELLAQKPESAPRTLLRTEGYVEVLGMGKVEYVGLRPALKIGGGVTLEPYVETVERRFFKFRAEPGNAGAAVTAMTEKDAPELAPGAQYTITGVFEHVNRIGSDDTIIFAITELAGQPEQPPQRLTE